MPESPTLALTEIVAEPSYVVGFPAYIALTLGTEPATSILTRVPTFGWSGTRGMVGVTLMPIGVTRIITAQDPLPLLDVEGTGSVARLGGGEKRRVLVDLSEFLPEQLPPGHYTVVVAVGPEAIRATSPRINLSFRPPDAQEGTVLSNLRDQVAARGSWGQWTRLPPFHARDVRPPWGPSDPLRFNLILRELYYGCEALSEIGLDILDSLTGLFVPEREVLRAELLAARGDPEVLARQVDYVNRDFPGLAYWAAAIKDGRSDIAWTRRVQTS